MKKALQEKIKNQSEIMLEVEHVIIFKDDFNKNITTTDTIPLGNIEEHSAEDNGKKFFKLMINLASNVAARG